MTAILYLDVDDEITSAVARIRRATEDRIVFVLPLGSRLATSRINFRILAREATVRGRTLEVVSPDGGTRALVASAGLAVHLSVAALQGEVVGTASPGGVSAPPRALVTDSEARAGGQPASQAAPGIPVRPSDDELAGVATGRERRTVRGAGGGLRAPASASAAIPSVGPTPRRSWRPLAVGLLLVVVIIGAGGAAAVTVLPSAAIQVSPAVIEIGPLDLSISAEPGVTQPDPGALVVPARRISFDIVAEQTFAATGVRVEDTAATGEVMFSSLDTGKENRIPAGSIVRTVDGIAFATTADVVLPIADIVARIDPPRFEIQPSSAKVAIVAVEPGLAGNVLSNTIVVVPQGEHANRTTVTNEAPTTGGTHAEFQIVQQADVDAALAALEADLARQFEARITDPATVPAGAMLFSRTAELGDPVPSADPASLVGQEVPEFTLGFSATGTVVTVDEAPIQVLADAHLRSEVPPGFTLDEISIDPRIGTPIVAGGTVTFPVTIRAVALHDVDLVALREEIRGRPLHEARAILEAIGPTRIELWPDWVTSIPSLDARLTITLVAPSAGGARVPGAGGTARR